jgi:hypothetical protein
VVSIIPVRGGNGEMERLRELGAFAPPTLAQLEDSLDRCVVPEGAVVTADLWDVDRLSACETCKSSRIERLARVNLTGVSEPRIGCERCGGGMAA